MTTAPDEPQPTADLQEPASGPGLANDASADPEADGTDGSTNTNTDAMGIDEDDPIDATLVGGPVDGGDDQGATTQPAGSAPPTS